MANMPEQFAQPPLTLFYSYDRKDEALRDELEMHLSLLRRQGKIRSWQHRDIHAGDDWQQEAHLHLLIAQIILLLISPDFLASDYCYSIEMQHALARHNAGEAQVIPILLRPVSYEGAPFSKLQLLPRDAVPITKWGDRDDAWKHVVEELRMVIVHFSKIPDSPIQTIPISSVWHVPYRRNPFFTGREALLIQLHEWFTQKSIGNTVALNQSLAINGLGGIGKTQTALEYAYRYRQEYRAVLWVTAKSAETVLTDFLHLATVLHLPERESQDQQILLAAVKAWLAREPCWLLILDNADDIALACSYLPEGDALLGHVLLTTRAQAGGLLAHVLPVEEMQEGEGVLLLLRRAKVLSSDATLEQACEKVRSEAMAIVEELGGLPLAIDQAGAYIEETGCSLVGYLTLYRTRRKELLQRRSALPSMHPEPVATTWSLSFLLVEQANPAATELLLACSFLDPDAIPEDLLLEGHEAFSSILASVIADPFSFNQAIEELRKFSLIQRNRERRTVSMHRLVQAVLRDELVPDLQRQWAKCVIQVVNRAYPVVAFETWDRCWQYLPHAVVCAQLIEHHQVVSREAVHLLNAMGHYLYSQGFYSQAQPYVQQALALANELQGEQEKQDLLSLTFNNLARLYRAQGKYKLAEPLCQRALAICEKSLGPEHPETATTLNNLAKLYQAQGKYELADSLYHRALAICEKSLGLEHPETATTLNNLASLYRDQGKYELAEPLCQRALAIKVKSLGLEHPEIATTLNILARLYQAQGKYELADSLYHRALAIKEQNMGLEHPEIATTLNNLASLYRDQGKYELAEPLYHRALAIKEKSVGLEHPEIATTLNNLASLYRDQGKYELAEPLYHRALAIYEQSVGPEHPEIATTLNNLARLYRDQGKYELAEPLYHRALAIKEQNMGLEHPEIATTLNNLARLYQAQGEYELADSLYHRALTIYEQSLGLGHPFTAIMLNNLAKLYQAQGKYELAEPLYHRALAIKEESLGLEHPEIAMALNNLAKLYQAQGKYELAEPLYHRALAIKEESVGPDHPQIAVLWYQMAQFYQVQRKYELAEQCYQCTLAIDEQAYGFAHPEVATDLEAYAKLLFAMEQGEEAEKLLNRARGIRILHNTS